MSHTTTTVKSAAITLNKKPSFIETMKLSGFSVKRDDQKALKRIPLSVKESRCCEMATD